MRCIRAIESGPPETAATMPEAWFKVSKRCPSLSSESTSSGGGGAAIAWLFIKFVSGSAALDALLLAVGCLANGGRGLGILAVEFGKDRAGAILGPETVQRDPEPQQGIGRLGGIGMLGRDVQELLRGLAVPAALEIGLAQPEGRLGHQLVAGIGLEEAAKAHLGLIVLLLTERGIGGIEIGTGIADARRRDARARPLGNGALRQSSHAIMRASIHRSTVEAVLLVLLDQITDPRELPAGQRHGTVRVRRQRGRRRRGAERPRSAGSIRRFGGVEEVAAALRLGRGGLGRGLRGARGRG